MSTSAVAYADVPDTDISCDAHRPRHADFLADLDDSGRLRVSGPLEGGTGALLLIKNEPAGEIENLLGADPLRQEGLVAERTVRAWSIVVGGLR